MYGTHFIPPFIENTENEHHSFSHFKVRPINGAIGAELSNLKLSGDYSEDLQQELKQALNQHLVLVLRDQTLTPAQLADLGKIFGELHINPFVNGTSEVPEVMEVRSEQNNEKRFTGLWHSDISWEAFPAMATLLYAKEVPSQGGDTLFANMYLALSSLTPAYQALLNPLKAEHRVDQHNIPTISDNQQPVPVVHPVVRTHPQTGRKALYINEYFTSRLENMTPMESQSILHHLFAHSVRPDFCCRVKWRPGTLVIWDNQCTIHYATNDYAGANRVMYRVTVQGDKPV